MPVSVNWPANEPSFSASSMKGRSRGASSAVIDGKLTAFEIAPLSRSSDICSAICNATFSCASVVAAPRCGVHTTLGWPNSGLSVAGSSVNTSKAAPATWPESSAARNASSSTSPPRAQLMMRTPFFIAAIALPSMMPLVLSVSGVCSVTKSARLSSSGRSTFSTPNSAARSGARKGSSATTFIFNPSARLATIEPTLPQPMTPSVLLVISTPMKRFFSHFPACVDASACGICRASANISVIACSAVVIELPNGVFITMMPLAVAAGMSTLSTPMPARPITLRRFARSKTLGVTLVAERTARPSKLPMTSASFSLSAPSFGWKSTSTPRSLKICTAAGESASEIRTLGRMLRPLLLSSSAKAGLACATHDRSWCGTSRRLRQRVLGLGEGPVEPQGERLDIGALHRRAAPDAQARRRITIRVDVVGDALFLQRGGDALDERRLRLGGKFSHRRIDDLQAHRRVRAQRRIPGEEFDPRRRCHPVGDHFGIGIGARHQRLEPTDRLRPGERVEIILDAQHRRGVDGFTFEDTLDELAALGQPKDFRHRPGRRVAFQALDCARRQDQHAVRRLAAQGLLPGEGDDIELRPIESLREDRKSV